jgi:hypothetical protein
MIAEGVAIKSSVIEIVQTMEIMLCKLVMSELVVSQLVVAKLIVVERVVTGVFEIVAGNPPSISGHCVIVTEIMGSELMTAAAHGVTSKSACMQGVSRMSAQCVATPPMTNVGQATMGSKPMVPTASAMPAATPTVKPSKPTATAVPATTSTAPAVKATASTSTPTPFGKCRDIRHGAKRAHRNARGQNAYRSLLHGTFPTRRSKSSVRLHARAPHRSHLPLTVFARMSF